MNIPFREGSHVTAMIYRGPSKVVADAASEYLTKCMIRGTLIPFPNDIKFNIKVINTSTVPITDLDGNVKHYIVDFAGELVSKKEDVSNTSDNQ